MEAAATAAAAREAAAMEAAVALTKLEAGAAGRGPLVLRAVLRRWRRRCWLAWRRALLEASPGPSPQPDPNPNPNLDPNPTLKP